MQAPDSSARSSVSVAIGRARPPPDRSRLSGTRGASLELPGGCVGAGDAPAGKRDPKAEWGQLPAGAGRAPWSPGQGRGAGEKRAH